MNPWVRWFVLGASAVAIVVLFVVLQPGEADERASPTVSPTATATASPEPSPTGTTSPSPSPTEPPGPEAHQIEVTVRGGEVRGPDRPSVAQGGIVVLVVRADVSDHVHVHGYDLVADVAPGQPARIRFRANLPGVFEVELEDAGRPLLELEITP